MPNSPPAVKQPCKVCGFVESDAADWDAYVLAHPEGTIFHTLRWRDALRSILHHRDTYLTARRGTRLVGILPLVEIRSLLFGTTLISVPFGVYGGIVADDEEARRLLVEHASAIAKERRARYVELRHVVDHDLGLPASDIYYTFIADVPEDPADCLARIPRKARAEVRKALAQDAMTAHVGRVGVAELYRLFSINKRQLGSPIFPSSLFWHVKNLLGDDCSILSVEMEGRTVAAVMSFIYKDTVMPYYSGSVIGAERLKANNFMYFKLMEWAAEQGLKRFDFGRSRDGTGAFRFKKHQGFDPTPLHYEYILETAETIPSLNPSNPKFELAKKVFRRLPLPLAQKVGSWVAKRAPF